MNARSRYACKCNALVLSAVLLSVCGIGILEQGDIDLTDGLPSYPPATIRYVDDSGGSTYTTISDALSDALEGDLIVIAPGDYTEMIVIDIANISVSGNTSDGEVRISYSGGSPLTVDGISRALISGLNMSASNDPALSVTGSDNVTVSGCAFWSFSGNKGAVSISNSENVRIEGDSSAGPTRIRSQGDNNDGLYLFGSERVWLTGFALETNGADAHGIHSDGSSWNVFFNGTLRTNGLTSDAIRGVNANSGRLSYVDTVYTGNMISLQSGHFDLEGIVFPMGDVNIGVDASANVLMPRTVRVIDEEGAPVQDVDAVLSVDGSIVYSSPFFGGSDDRSDNEGSFGRLELLTRKYSGSNAPVQGVNRISLSYSGGDVEVTREALLDANGTSPTSVALPDFEFPEPPRNPRAVTVSEDRMDLSFEASPSLDVTGYDIWKRTDGPWTHDRTALVAGSMVFTQLEPGTEYSFKVETIDDAGYRSDGNDCIISNRTLPLIIGGLSGLVLYEGGPLGGGNAEGAVVRLIAPMGGEFANSTVGADGAYAISGIPFADNYRVEVDPPSELLGGVDRSGYLPSIEYVNISGPTHLNMDLIYHLYVPPPPPTNGTLEGMVVYTNGDLSGQVALNATVHVLDSSMSHIAMDKVDEMGTFTFRRLPFGDDYTVRAVVPNAVLKGGTDDGYPVTDVTLDFLQDTSVTIEVVFYVYVPPPPPSGPLSGKVVYDGGPKDGEPAYEATLTLRGSDLSILSEATSNATGHYYMENVPLGTGYTLVVTPSSEDGAIIGSKSGYLETTSSVFSHSDETGTVRDFDLEYYEHIPEAAHHPNVTIFDKDGDPLEGVKVTARSNGTVYVAYTDENGFAEFPEFDGEFPEGTSFKAEKDGYETVEWTEGEPIPEMGKDAGEPADALMIAMIVLVIVLAAAALVIFFLSKKKEEEAKEE